MNSPGPRVSVILATYNQARFLAESIESVLSQDFDDVEIIVVNDGSTDHTSEVASQFDDVILIEQENLGQGAAVNNGVANARGELIAFLDSDDLLAPDTLAMRVAMFDDDPDLQYSQGALVEFLCPTRSPDSANHRKVGHPRPGPISGTTMVRRQAQELVGGWSIDVKLSAFMDWLMKAKDLKLKSYQHQEVLLKRRLHDDNIGIRESASRSDYVRVLKLALDRRRKSGQSD